jgi:hypothetical protein
MKIGWKRQQMIREATDLKEKEDEGEISREDKEEKERKAKNTTE